MNDPETTRQDEVENLEDEVEILQAESTQDAPLEEKYKKQMRQIFPQKIELPISTIKQMIKEQIKLNPDFQRRDRWDNKRRSRFIESIIMNVPIPPVFLGEDKYGQYVVLDGRQRLTALNEFLKNTYRLEGLTVWSEFNNCDFNELERRNLEKTLTRRFVPAILLLKESSPEVKYDVFDRLNTGGMTANNMEIRNAVFQGPFNRVVHSLSEDLDFRYLWGIPEDKLQREQFPLYKDMGDVQLVLRFFALYDPDKMKGSFKWYLGHFLGERNAEYESNRELEGQDRAKFKRAVRSIRKVFGNLAFLPSPESKKRSAPLADALMVAFSELDSEKLSTEYCDALKAAIEVLTRSNEEFMKAIGSGTNGKGAIIQRVGMARDAVRAAAPNALFG